MTDQPQSATTPAVQPAPVPANVKVAPVPTNVKVAGVRNDQGDAMVLLQLSTPAGVGYYFLDPESAVRVGNALRAEGKAGISRAPKVVTPPSGLLVPGR